MSSPYPEAVELEGELTEIGTTAAGDGILVSTQSGRIQITGLDEADLQGLASGLFSQVRITIEPIEEQDIETAAEYDAALNRVGDLMRMNPDLDSPEGRELARLSRLVEAYEEKHFPITQPPA